MRKILISFICMVVFLFFGICQAQIPVAQPVQNQENDSGFSILTFMNEDETTAFVKIFGGLTGNDAVNIWNDFRRLENKIKLETEDIVSSFTSIELIPPNIEIFVNSPGGEAFAGTSIANQIEKMGENFNITCHASGLVASAALLVYASCENRASNADTLFMIHEIRSQPQQGYAQEIKEIEANRVSSELLNNIYCNKMAEKTDLTKEQWAEMAEKITFFTAKQALDWGLVDYIE